MLAVVPSVRGTVAPTVVGADGGASVPTAVGTGTTGVAVGGGSVGVDVGTTHCMCAATKERGSKYP
jgi:hypothetical protein